jgi:acetyltransferase-like isoleucine patch superfamily enzyme
VEKEEKVSEKIVLENGAVIEQSFLDETSVCYRNARLTKSQVNEKCTVGDNSILFKSELSGYNSINRNNYITDSIIGIGSYTGHNTTIKNTQIGKFCSLSWDVSIGGKNHNYQNTTTFPEFHWNRVLNGSTKILENKLENTCIGNDVWIGSGAIILRGVKVGDGAVIGAGAVVTNDVEPYTVVAGVPAKPIKKRFEDDIIQECLKIKWWDWKFEKLQEKRHLLTGELTYEIIKQLKG